MRSLKRAREIGIATAVFLLFYFFPARERVLSGAREALLLAHWYAREHVILCLIPAFFIAGAISVFVSKESVMRYLGPGAPKPVAYGVASVAGTVLAVCSCTVLPLFAGIYLNGAGLGPASTFLYSGPAINVLAIVLTARVLGAGLGLARAIAAIGASLLIGLLMAFFFRREETARLAEFAAEPPAEGRPLRQTVLFMATLVAILVLATWGHGTGLWERIFALKWKLVAAAALVLLVELRFFFGVKTPWLVAAALAATLGEVLSRGHEIAFLSGVVVLSFALWRTGGEAREWFESSYWLARQILPLLFLGVLGAGFFLGRPGHEALIPSHLVAELVGGNGLAANFFAAVSGAFMYFATLTEVPILQGLLGAGMGKGPALALLLSGPAVSLPSMLVIRSVLGTRKTLAYVALVVMISTLCGWFYGHFLVSL
ncbi:permease [Thermosulfurimonas sp. F29]|uniref:permease n=1 Tax=Thermosulfurimonas sp. F29 TaxID=2867247 RepID=UPI001C83CBD4|nr:permease [Thermosulfurimonas sp. F29]MBX6422783.1 permease [Thermosulfurimonas sp. F29]